MTQELSINRNGPIIISVGCGELRARAVTGPASALRTSRFCLTGWETTHQPGHSLAISQVPAQPRHPPHNTWIIAGEQSEVLTSTDEEYPEMREVKLRELPSEVWADVIAFLSFQEKVKLLP